MLGRRKEEGRSRPTILSLCVLLFCLRACAQVCFYGENLIKKILFFGPERKTAAGFNKKKIIISITFKEKNEREEGVREAKLDKRERERSRERAQRMKKKKSSLRVFSSFCRPPTAL